MKVRPFILLFIVTLAILPGCRYLPGNSSPSNTQIENITIKADEFEAETEESIAVTKQGLTMAEASFKSTYISPAIKAPFAFNAVIPQWIADVPGTANLEIMIRTGSGEEDWSEWFDIHPNVDWIRPEDGDTVGELILVPDGTHQFVQYMVNFGRNATLTEPILREITFTFIDSTSGPTLEEMLEAQAQLDAAQEGDQAILPSSNNPKPPVISREVWCVESGCNYTDDIFYQPVTHLILHHTVTSNSTTDWPAVVRAIWSFHTYTRGWGDIGYNFLVDVDGFVYEGHIGGDDVIGTHAAGANEGSMGVAILGVFTDGGITPPETMLNRVVDLFSWKAEQRSIDVFDVSDTLPDISWGLPNVMGHRDVYGTTQCPGSRAHALIPFIRDEVADRIGLVSPYQYVDELGSEFTLSDANWHVGQLGCGDNTHAYYTFSTTDPDQAVNTGEWRPNIPAAGRYQIDAYAPFCNTGRSETKVAKYIIEHANGSSEVVVNQDANIGLWSSLGEFNLTAGNDTVIRLGDLTAAEDGRAIWYDALRLLPIDVQTAAAPISPADGAWATQPSVTFNWAVTNPETVVNTKFEVATDSLFEDIIVAQAWETAVTTHAHTFTEDYANLYWRITLEAITREKIVSETSQFGLDTQPPTSAVTTIYQLPSGLSVIWSGQDALNGITHYNVDYAPVGGSQWQRWLTAESGTIGFFTPPDPNQFYLFRSQATDSVGNIEVEHTMADASSAQAVPFSHRVLIPVTMK